MRFQSIGTDALLSTFHLYRHQSRGFLPLPCPCHAARETCPPKVSLKPRQSSRHVSECLQICARTAQHLDSRGKVRMQSNMMLSGEETTAVGCMWLRERASSWVKSPNNRSNEHNMPAKHISSKTNTRAFVRTLMHRWRSYATHTLCSSFTCCLPSRCLPFPTLSFPPWLMQLNISLVQHKARLNDLASSSY